MKQLLHSTWKLKAPGETCMSKDISLVLLHSRFIAYEAIAIATKPQGH